ncbi:MAG: FxsA family protein [Gammaproteobacteria bacterium]|nr:FxsA family protein [Gammaproteobacteria bacterium]
MFRLLFLLFLIIPVIEIYLLIQVGGIIGALNTVGLVVGTAILGAFLLKRQGLSTFARVQNTMARGEIPAIEMMEGIILLVCGALLLTPGFFTDILGFLGLIPVTRRGFVIWLLKKGAFIHFGGGPRNPSGTTGPTSGSHGAIEGEYRRED